MGEPSHKLFPWCAKLVPAVLREFETRIFVVVKHIRKLLCGAVVNNNGILLEVEIKTAGVEISTAYSTKPSVYHNHFGVMEPILVYPYVNTMFHKPVNVIEHAVGRKGYVAMG